MESIYKSSDTTSYLKKSELPKNVSAFKNDAGYISSTALDEWLRTHSYISKEEIQSLIASANLVVIDSVQESSDSEAIRRLEEYDNQLRGEIVEIKDRITSIETGSGFIPSSKESSFATKEELNDVKDDVDDVKESISQLESDSQNYLTEHQSLADYAKKSEIPTIVSLTDYAKKTDIPSLNGYVKKTALETTLKDYALKDNVYTKSYVDTVVDTLLPKTDASRTYATKSDVTSTYITKKDAANKYLSIADYIGIKDATTISEEYKDKQLQDLINDLNVVMSGFYIINQTDVVIVKNHKLISIFKDGVQHGLDGKSAYEVAQANGFIGTEAEWLESLKGADGVIGVDGKSAYEVACDNGFDGSEDEWLDSLKGEDGKSAYEIANKNNEFESEDAWIESLGGIPGKSAYEIAKENNPSLTSEEEWLESLKGTDGEDGVDGINGKSAYEIAKENDPSLTSESAWLESLKGADGEDGTDGANGKSAYEIAYEHDNTIGSEEEWIESLGGIPGKSAYEIALENGFEGSEEEWLESLKVKPTWIEI